MLGLVTSFWISQILVVLGETWHELWQEGGNNVWILDKLAHVVDNDGRLSLNGSLTLGETTIQERNHDGEGWLVDISNESGSTEQVNSLWNILWLGDTLDEFRNEALNILVDNQTADLLHGTVCHLLDFWLGIPHRLGDDWDEFWYAESKLCWGGLDQGLDESETCDLFLPFLCGKDRVDDVWEGSLDSVGVDSLDQTGCSVLSSVLDWDHLVTNGGKDEWEEDDEVWLDGGGGLGVLSNRLDGVESALSCGGILLVGELLLECCNGAVKE